MTVPENTATVHVTSAKTVNPARPSAPWRPVTDPWPTRDPWCTRDGGTGVWVMVYPGMGNASTGKANASTDKANASTGKANASTGNGQMAVPVMANTSKLPKTVKMCQNPRRIASLKMTIDSKVSKHGFTSKHGFPSKLPKPHPTNQKTRLRATPWHGFVRVLDGPESAVEAGHSLGIWKQFQDLKST